jgi:hypothetical protein
MECVQSVRGIKSVAIRALELMLAFQGNILCLMGEFVRIARFRSSPIKSRALAKLARNSQVFLLDYICFGKSRKERWIGPTSIQMSA